MPVLNQKRQVKNRPDPKEEASNNRFQAVIQESADVFWMLTPEGQMRESYQSWQAFTGQKARDCRIQGWRDALHPADRPEVDEALMQAVTTRHTSEATCQVRHASGSYRSLALRIIPVPSALEDVHELVISGRDITRHKLHLRMSEAQLQLALKTSRVGMWDWDVVGDQMTWTEQCKALFGWPANTPVTYRSFLAAVHPDDRERVDRLNSRVLGGLAEFRAEYRVIWPDGSVHWIADRACGIFNTRGKAVHMVGANIDITDLKQAEEQAREAERYNRTILESITDAFAYLDAEWRYTYVNQRMEEYLGKSREEMLGQCIWEVFPYLSGTPFERVCRKAMKTQKAEHVEMYFQALQFWGDIRVYPTCDGVAIYGNDITRRKQMEAALCESETRFRHFVDSNIIGITISNMEGQIYEANDAFLSLVGYTRADLVAGELNWVHMTLPEDLARDRQAQQEVRATGIFRPFEKEYLAKDGRHVPVLVGGTLFHHGDGFASQRNEALEISFVLDMSAQRSMEQQKDLFLGMASHELKTPLAALKGILQLAERRLKRARATSDVLPPHLEAFMEDLSKHLETSVRQVDLQAHLINDLLDISRIRANTMELSLQPCDLASIVRETIEDLRVIAPERSIFFALPEGISAPVLADAERISQVVTNYITNAIRYSSPEKPVMVGLEVAVESARVWVKDQGPGLTEEARQKIWQSFQKANGIAAQSGSGKGLGLGLYICQTLIAHHHGEVGVESVLGEGSTFWFTLPLHK